MKVIDKAFKEALENIEYKPRKGWWGYRDGDTHYIMRYGHVIFSFNDKLRVAKIHECCTRSDKRGIDNILELHKERLKNEQDRNN